MVVGAQDSAVLYEARFNKFIHIQELPTDSQVVIGSQITADHLFIFLGSIFGRLYVYSLSSLGES